MSVPTTHIRRLLLTQILRDRMDRRARELEHALPQHDITILARDESPFEIRIQYRHAKRIHEAVFPHAMLDAEAAGVMKPWR